jgi:hypothetical protein
MSSDIIHGNAWSLSGAERANPTWTASTETPKASDCVYELGLTLALPLALALIVNICLFAAGVPSP